MSRTAPTLPIPNDPRRVALHIGRDLVLIELAACILLRRIAETRMNHITDALLLPATHHHGAHVQLHFQILHRRQRTRDLLTPGSAVAGYMCFLRPTRRNNRE